MSSIPCELSKVSTTCWASPALINPVSTKTQVNWSPIALCTRAAATAESTPPDSPHIAFFSPTISFIPATDDSTTEAMFQSFGQPQTSWIKRLNKS